jgi:hypothetical protein
VPDEQSLTDFLVDHARVSEHVTALILLLVKKGLITGPERSSVPCAASRRTGSVSRPGTLRAPDRLSADYCRRRSCSCRSFARFYSRMR